MGQYGPTLGSGRVHQYAFAGVDVPITVDPDDANTSVGPATCITVTSSGDLSFTSSTGVTTTLTGLRAGDAFKNVNVATVLAASTITGFIVAWGDGGLVDLDRTFVTGTVTADQGAPNAGGALSWPVVDRSTGTTGAAVPGLASYIAGRNAAGNLTGVTIAAGGGVAIEGVAGGVPVLVSQSAPNAGGALSWPTQDRSDVLPFTVLNPATNYLTVVGSARNTDLAAVPLTSNTNLQLVIGGTIAYGAAATGAMPAQVSTCIDATGNLSYLQASSSGLLPQFPIALVGGRLDINAGAWMGSTLPTIGQKTMASSIPVVIASDQSSVAATVTGTVAISGTPSVNVATWIGSATPTVGQKAMVSCLPVAIASDQSALTVSGTAAVGVGPTGNPVYVAGSDGANIRALPVDAGGAVVTVPKVTASSTYSASRFTDFGANATANVKASAGNLLSVRCENSNAGVRYIQIHNTAGTPAGGAVPVLSFMIPPAAGGVPGVCEVGCDFLTANGTNLATGIAFAFSTALGTYTAGAAGDQSTTVMYI